MNKPALIFYPNHEQLKKYKAFFKNRWLRQDKYYEMGHGFYGLAKFLTILNNMEFSMSTITKYINKNHGKAIDGYLIDLLLDINKIKHVIGF